MMLSYSIFTFVISFIYQLNITFAEYPFTATQPDVSPKQDGQATVYGFSHANSITTFSNEYYTKTKTYRPSIPALLTNTFPLSDSNCFCSYNIEINLLSCSPLLHNSRSFPLSYTNISFVNVTLNDCKFSSNHLSLPIIKGKNIDHLQLYDINHQDYLVFDGTSFSTYTINHIYIYYSFQIPITMLLISNETFSSPSISLSLRTLYIDSCYLITLYNPFGRLFLLESLTFINIHQFSWFDLQQQIVRLPNLRQVYIGDEIILINNSLANAVSCQEISSQWALSYLSIQTCSCKFISFLTTISRVGNSYTCLNSNNTIDIIDDTCQLNGKVYKIQNQTNLFCNKCLSYQCPNGTLCTETSDSGPNCVLVSKCDYDTIRNRIPLTPYTKQFLFQQSQEYLTINRNNSLAPSEFNSVATMLINSSKNQTQNSPNDAQMFHQTFSEMLNQPWSPQVYSSAGTAPTTAVWQQLIVSLDESVSNINDSDPKFEFESQPISTMSLRFPTGQQPQNTFGWKITNNNKITENITNSDSIDKNVTSRVFLNFNNNQAYTPPCDPSNSAGNCTNRFSITSIKSPKLFFDTNRTPEYDVISIVAPSQNQQVTFYFDQKISSTNTNTTNSTTISSNSFYDQLDIMISEGTCMYLNTTSMIWQTDGCTTDRQLSNSTSVTCTCEHLTMFTVFFSLSCVTPSKTLEIISWIGCGLSLVGLSMTLIMFIVRFQPIKNPNRGISSSYTNSSQDLRNRIMSKPRGLSMVKSMLLILCILLILMNIIIFILTFIKSGRNLSCAIFSAALYYFTLTAFIWKFLFALQQSLFITNIFQHNWSNQRLFIIYIILTFTLPICPLLIMFIKYENYTFISSTCNYCWLSREFLLYGLMIPILTIVCFNLILYTYTMIHLCTRNRQQPGLRSTKSDHSRRMQNLKIGLFFAIIMGLSWILGFFLLIPNSYVQFVGNILFCVVNTLQGFAFSIMVFCMLEKKSFRECFSCFSRYKNQMKTTLNSTDTIIRQQSIPTSSDDNDTKIKTVYNSSMYTASITSTGDSNTLDYYPTEKLQVEKEEEHIYSTLIF